jgi:hypothetical protein
MNFLPDDYTAPKSNSGYMKLQDGENKFRILSRPVMGWEDWTLDKKPIRFRMDEKPLKSIDGKKPVRHFWSFIVWNYIEERIQVLHLTQATIRGNIENLCKDADWGAPFFYDIKIIKKGEGKEVEYMVNPLPHRPVSEDIKKAFIDNRCNLQALFENADPFSAHWQEYTQGIFTKDNVSIKEHLPNPNQYITDAQLLSLEEVLSGCDPHYKTSLSMGLLKTYACDTLDKMPTHIYEKVKSGAEENNRMFQKKKIEDIFG